METTNATPMDIRTLKGGELAMHVSIETDEMAALLLERLGTL